jgi:CHASE2 domain-containing sensor protein
MAKAVELRKAEPKLSESQAFARAYQANPQLAAQEKIERAERTAKAMPAPSTVAKRASRSVSEMVASRAAAVQRQHCSMNYQDCVAAVLNRDPTLRLAYQNEMQQLGGGK